MTKMRL